MRGELAALHERIAELQSAVAQLGTRLASLSTQTGLIATLEQVLGVRTILHNLARETFTGEGEMAELRALADDSGTRARLQDSADRYSSPHPGGYHRHPIRNSIRK